MPRHAGAGAQSRGEDNGGASSGASPGARGSWSAFCLSRLVTASSAARPWIERGRRRSGWGCARASLSRQLLGTDDTKAATETCGAGSGERSARTADPESESGVGVACGPSVWRGAALRGSRAQAPERDSEQFSRKGGRGLGMARKRRVGTSRTTVSAAIVLAVLWNLFGDFSCLGPRAVQGEVINPSWEWLGQDLYDCAVAEEDAETQCKCYTYDPNAVVKCVETQPDEPEASTKPGIYKSCTHDPKVQYSCDPDDLVCPSQCSSLVNGHAGDLVSHAGLPCLFFGIALWLTRPLLREN